MLIRTVKCGLRLRALVVLFSFFAAALVCLILSPTLLAQNNDGTDPSAVVAELLGAACRQNETQFSKYLTVDNAKAFAGLPDNERSALVKRFALSDDAGHPLLSTNADNHTVVRCETPGSTAEFEFGAPRVHENLAMVPVTIRNGQSTEFGLIREADGWKLISLGLVFFDIPQLSRQWATQDLVAREQSALQNVLVIASAVRKYRSLYGKMPDSLAQLGPAPRGEVSPDQAQMISAALANGAQGGYRFRYRVVAAPDGTDSNFELAATPDQYDRTGKHSYFLDAQGKIHGADKNGDIATPDDPILNTSAISGATSSDSPDQQQQQP